MEKPVEEQKQEINDKEVNVNEDNVTDTPQQGNTESTENDATLSKTEDNVKSNENDSSRKKETSTPEVENPPYNDYVAPVAPVAPVVPDSKEEAKIKKILSMLKNDVVINVPESTEAREQNKYVYDEGTRVLKGIDWSTFENGYFIKSDLGALFMDVQSFSIGIVSLDDELLIRLYKKSLKDFENKYGYK